MNKSRRNYVFIMVAVVLLCILNFLVIHTNSIAYGEEQSNPKKYFIGYNENINLQYLNQYILTNTQVSDNQPCMTVLTHDIGGRIKTVPDDPEREGYNFGGWFTEAECINQWDFETIPFPTPDNEDQQAEEEQDTENEEQDEEQEEKPSLTLYARWIEE